MQTMQRPPTSGKEKKQGAGADLARLLSTRGGLVGVALFAALLAGALLLVFLKQYRANITGEQARTVLVAKQVIPKGSSGDVIAAEDMFQATKAEGDEVKEGAIADPASLKGKSAAKEIFPGQQLTAADFTASSGAANTKLVGDQRAIALPVDQAHGMIGEAKPGDHVDVYASFDDQTTTGRMQASVRVLMRDAVVLKVPPPAKNGASNATIVQSVIVRAPDTVTPQMAFAADVGRLWIVARPQAGAKDSRVPTTTIQSLLASEAGGAR